MPDTGVSTIRCNRKGLGFPKSQLRWSRWVNLVRIGTMFSRKAAQIAFRRRPKAARRVFAQPYFAAVRREEKSIL
jgi:hypothetical protein